MDCFNKAVCEKVCANSWYRLFLSSREMFKFPHPSRPYTCWKQRFGGGRLGQWPAQLTANYRPISLLRDFQRTVWQHALFTSLLWSDEDTSLPNVSHSVLSGQQVDTMEYSRSARGKWNLHYKGFEYGRRRNNKFGSITWYCVDRQCKGNVVTWNGVVLKSRYHDCVTEEVNRKAGLTKRKKRARKESKDSFSPVCFYL